MTPARLSADEEAVLSAVDSMDLVGLASRMTQFPSQIPNEGELVQFLHREMQSLGLFDEVLLQPVVPGRANLVTVVRGSGGGKTILLNGHVDIPAPLGAWTKDPYEAVVDGDWLYGLGLGDMKAAVACQQLAAAAIAKAKADHAGDVVVSSVIHHNVCGLGTKFFLASWDEPIHAAINGEPTDLKMQVAHGGAWWFEIETYGRAVHTSRKEEGVDAIQQMTRILAALDIDRFRRSETDGIPGLPRLVVGHIEGGRSPSRTADLCRVKGDIRLVPGMTPRTMIEDLRAIVKEVGGDDPDFRAEVRATVHQRPFRINPTADIVELVGSAHRDIMGTPAVVSDGLPMSAYVTDSSDLIRAGIPTVVYGPADWRTDPDERVSIRDLRTAARVYALAAFRFTGPAS